MIAGRQCGPMEIEDMVKEGVRPDTYVWCKQMDDWQKAEEVPDICRYFRQRLAGMVSGQNLSLSESRTDASLIAAAEQEELLRQLPPMARGYVRKSGIKLSKDDSRQTQSNTSRTLPIILYLICLILIIIGFLIKF